MFLLCCGRALLVERVVRRRRQYLNRCIDKIELVDYHQVLEHEGIKFWCYNAGHVLGAAMFMIEIAVRWPEALSF